MRVIEFIKKGNQKKRTGFTLIELLVVIVLLSLLLLLISGRVISIINKAKDSAEEVLNKSITNSTDKWLVHNLHVFDDIEEYSSSAIGLDVVFIIDVSGSMTYAMNSSSATSQKLADSRIKLAVDAANNALNVLCGNKVSGVCENELTRVSYVFYSNTIRATMNLTPISNVPLMSIAAKQNQNNALTNEGSNPAVITYAVNQKVEVGNGTYTQLGIQRARNIFNATSDKGERIPVVILLSDGEPDRATTLTTSNQWVETAQSSANTTDAMVGLNTIRTAMSARQNIEAMYGNPIYFYTIGLGVTTKYGQFVLDPSNANVMTPDVPAIETENFTVVSGLTAAQLATAFGTDCQTLNALNGLGISTTCDATLATTGRTIIVPKLGRYTLANSSLPTAAQLATAFGTDCRSLNYLNGHGTSTTCNNTLTTAGRTIIVPTFIGEYTVVTGGPSSANIATAFGTNCIGLNILNGHGTSTTCNSALSTIGNKIKVPYLVNTYTIPSGMDTNTIRAKFVNSALTAANTCRFLNTVNGHGTSTTCNSALATSGRTILVPGTRRYPTSALTGKENGLYFLLNNPYNNDYKYPDKSFAGDMDANELNGIFGTIAQEIVNATKVVTVCVPFDRLLKDGFIDGSMKQADRDKLTEAIVFIDYIESINQHTYTLLRKPTPAQLQMCEDHMARE